MSPILLQIVVYIIVCENMDKFTQFKKHFPLKTKGKGSSLIEKKQLYERVNTEPNLSPLLSSIHPSVLH